MHDITNPALITRLDLPTNDLMSKVDAELDRELSTDHVKDPALDMPPDDVDTQRIKPTEGPEPALSPKQAEPLLVATAVDSTMKVTPQPVTPETPRMKEKEDTGIADKSATEVTLNLSNASDVQQPENADVTPTKSSGKAKHPRKSSAEGQPPNRVRIKSLDRVRNKRVDTEGYHSPDATPVTDDERRRRYANHRSVQTRRSSRKHYDDASSSDDDSSYFATHLPSPKSGRSFSLSSAGSAHARSPLYASNQNRESDASLSFSDESDEDMAQTHGVHLSPMIPPKGLVGDMHLYPQRITRMHSVSSLVSSASSEEDALHPAPRKMSAGSASSHTTTGTISEGSVHAEIPRVAIAIDSASSGNGNDANERLSPVMGEHVPSDYFFSTPPPATTGLKASPPPIMPGYSPPSGMLHPQPQPMTQEQLTAWVTAGTTMSIPPYSQNAGVKSYGSTLPTQQMHIGASRNVSDQSHSTGTSRSTLPFVYSEDDETVEGPVVQKLSGGGGSGAGSAARQHGQGQQQPQQQDLGGSAGFQGMKQSALGGTGKVAVAGDGKGDPSNGRAGVMQERGFKVYWERWIMLLYMSVLNLLSDWTCYSVAPIALLTEQAFGNIDPERLVVVFLGANAIATACEPIILARLGLRRTVLFGSLLLMIGSVVKSGGGVPPLLQPDLHMGHDELRLYLGFFLVGLSQPLYQCTPALLSASWFPEKERTMATGVALNANQLGIGFAFIFGTLLVSKKEDIPGYFGLLSTISTIVFLGTLIQFDDAPPTPPSSSARVMRGTLEVNLPSIDTIVQSVRGMGGADRPAQPVPRAGQGIAGSPSPAVSNDAIRQSAAGQANSKRNSSQKSSSGRRGGSTRRRNTGPRSGAQKNDAAAAAPSSAQMGPTNEAMKEIALLKSEAINLHVEPPSPMMPGRVGQQPDPQQPSQGAGETTPLYQDREQEGREQGGTGQGPVPDVPPQPGMAMPGGMPPPGMVPPFGAMPHPQYQYPYWDPRFQQQMQQQAMQQQAMYQQPYFYYPQVPHPYYYPMGYPGQPGYDMSAAGLPAAVPIDEGAEPIVTITPHHLDIDIRDDQVIRSTRACMSRPGFVHALVSFTVSGIVINTLSTYMDYLVRLNNAPRAYTGIVGGTFQFVIMISSLIIGKQTDRTRAYYSVTIGMLVVGAFGLAECGVSLDADRGQELRWALIVVAALVGPLQPVSTELGVEVAYPLSENTVLVIQQLFSNLLSALFIPFFKALKDIGASDIDDSEMYEHPQYTFSFYLLIVLHTAATVFFATFNGKYLRYEHELQKQAEEERALYNLQEGEDMAQAEGETQPLLNPVV